MCVGVEGLCVGLHARGVEDDDDDQGETKRNRTGKRKTENKDWKLTKQLLFVSERHAKL